jgi:mevalonate kinase
MGKGSGYGKVIFFGEHFVVHGAPGIVSAIDAATDAEDKRALTYVTNAKPPKATAKKNGFSKLNPSNA